MKTFSLLLVTVLLFLIAGIVFADSTDDEGDANDPVVNARANACYTDGTMANKCDTEWEWQCGWFLIRFEAGILSREDFPTTCAILLSPVPELPSSIGGAPGAGTINP